MGMKKVKGEGMGKTREERESCFPEETPREIRP